MKKQATDRKKSTKVNPRVFTVLLILGGILMVTGIALLAVEPIKTMNREKITGDVIDVMAERMSQEIASAASSGAYDPDSDIEVTFVVPRDGNEVAGEDIDVFTDDEDEAESIRKFVASRQAKLPKNVTLTCIGVLQIEKINKKLPVWNSTNSVALRYGVGLYEHSVKPGKKGNSAILGHNMRNTTLFSKLKKCEVGDNVKFIKLDGTVYNYRIDKIEIVYKNKLPDYCDASASKKEQLTLVTCANEDYGHGWRRVVICHPVK
ncbi:MAG: sortase [Ruminococcaceae bacterium]|nr:sortase [Oscillospiraceae bacterium]